MRSSNSGLLLPDGPLDQFIREGSAAQCARQMGVRERVIRQQIPQAIAGGDAMAQHPLLPPTLTGNQISVDTHLQQPTRITRMIADLTLQRFLIDRVFNNAGGVSGGAVIYDEVQANELYLVDDIEVVMPGDEFPVVTSARLAPKIATVKKWGGKTWITDEARDRNDVSLFTNEIRKLGNTVVRKLNQRAIEVLEAAIASNARHSFAGHNWQTTVLNGNSPTSPFNTPIADIAMSQRRAFEDELGVSYNLLLLGPQEGTTLGLLYGDALDTALVNNGIDEVYISNRVAAGTGYFIAKNQVGDYRVEKPLGSETWREPGTERTWVQSSVRPLMFVQNPYAVVKITTLAG